MTAASRGLYRRSRRAAVRQSVADYEIAPTVEPACQAETAAKVERVT